MDSRRELQVEFGHGEIANPIRPLFSWDRNPIEGQGEDGEPLATDLERVRTNPLTEHLALQWSPVDHPLGQTQAAGAVPHRVAVRLGALPVATADAEPAAIENERRRRSIDLLGSHPLR